jgi:hypothetical protein
MNTLHAFENNYNQSLDLFIYNNTSFKVRVHDYGRLVEDFKFSDYDKAVLKFNELEKKYNIIFNK